MKSRTIHLAESELAQLELLWKTSDVARTRNRCHAVLLSHQGFNVKQLSKIFMVERQTISAWLDRWESDGLSGLDDLPGRGRKPIFSEAEKKNPI